MTLKLNLKPLVRRYNVAFDGDTRASVVRGRLPRTRLDQDDSNMRVALNFSLNLENFAAFTAFKERLEYTGEQFLMDLIVGDFSLREYTCTLVPGTLTENNLGGPNVDVSMEVEVEPVVETSSGSDFDNELLLYYERRDEIDESIYPLLEQLVNFDLPAG